MGPGCRLLRGCERLGPFNSYKIATERHLMFKICLITNFESLISFLALNSCKKVYLNIFGVYFCMSMSRTAPWAHPWSKRETTLRGKTRFGLNLRPGGAPTCNITFCDPNQWQFYTRLEIEIEILHMGWMTSSGKMWNQQNVTCFGRRDSNLNYRAD